MNILREPAYVCLSIWPMCKATAVWFLAIACRCTWRWAAAYACVSIFTCTSPWEIYGYGLQKKIVSPLLEKFFYKRGYDRSATTAITVEEVMRCSDGAARRL